MGLTHYGRQARITARLGIADKNEEFAAGDEIVTYVARNFEPYRGFPSFMRSLPRILSARPKARVLMVGGDDVSYGAKLPRGETYRKKLLEELGNSLYLTRVHFLGKIAYPAFVKVLQVSRVHVYLTYCAPQKMNQAAARRYSWWSPPRMGSACTA